MTVERAVFIAGRGVDTIRGVVWDPDSTGGTPFSLEGDHVTAPVLDDAAILVATHDGIRAYFYQVDAGMAGPQLLSSVEVGEEIVDAHALETSRGIAVTRRGTGAFATWRTTGDNANPIGEYAGTLLGADAAAVDDIGAGMVTWQDAGEVVVELSILHEDTVILREQSRSTVAGGVGGGSVAPASIANVGHRFVVVWMERRTVRAAMLACETHIT